MLQICTQCERSAIHGNLWCQEPGCPIGQMPVVLNYGESFSDFVIKKSISVLRTSTIYEATRNKEPVLLKISHHGFHERLKREANFLMQLQSNNITHEALPTLLPAHVHAAVNEYPYAKTVFRGQTEYFSVFEHSHGEFLRGELLKNPQPWYQYAGWITLTIADVIGLIHSQNHLHLGIAPESIQVRYDKDGIPRTKLLDLGAITDAHNVSNNWHNAFAPTAYIAPELISNPPRADQSTDVYGLGLIFYEMLSGRPAHEFRLRTEPEIMRSIMKKQPDDTKRTDLTILPDAAMQAIHSQSNRRQNSVSEFAGHLMSVLPVVPKERLERKMNWRLLGIIIGIALVISMLIILAFVLQGEETASLLREALL